MSKQRQLIAAVDMGSSSFRMIVARVEELNGQSQIYIIDTLREPVRLGAGLNAQKYLDDASQERALGALSRFGERLRSFKPGEVRAVATNAVRVARNAVEFIGKAEAALGFPIDVISGVEEARLVYCGVAHQLPIGQGKRLRSILVVALLNSLSVRTTSPRPWRACTLAVPARHNSTSPMAVSAPAP